MANSDQKLYSQAYWLSLFTIFYNIIEGLVSMVLGYTDGTLSLFGFGADSFIEVMSGVGIAMMIIRIKQNPNTPKSNFEITALKITGTAFYLLATGLIAGIVLNIIKHKKPETTLWGVIISLISIAVMVWLMNAKNITSGSGSIYIDKAGTLPVDAILQLAQMPPVGALSFDHTENITSDIHRFNIGGQGAIGFELIMDSGKFFIEGGGNYGFIPMQKDDANGNNNTGAGTVTTGYLFQF